MAVSTTAVAVKYDGNESTITAYVIPFRFENTDTIYVATAIGLAEPALMDAADYTVARLLDGSGGSVVTAEAIDSAVEVTIFRATPLVQPTVFQLAGPFPAKANETALDRLLMQVQEINRRLNESLGLEPGDFLVIPEGGSSGGDVLTWANPAARGAVKPSRAGQLGVERSTQTIWIAQSTTIGDWEEYAPRRSNRVILGLLADAGEPAGGYQALAQARLTEWAPDGVIFAGDNNYNGAAGYTADWAEFGPWIVDGKAFPALGNHDVDEAGWQARLDGLFPYLPGNRRYYLTTFGDGLVDVFVLNSGLNSIGGLVEPDGNAVGSVQHAWFASALAASRARWKIAVFHHPPTTLDRAENRVSLAMEWPELAGVNLILCGHTHLLEVLKWNDVILANLSSATKSTGEAEGALQGSALGSPYALWADDVNRGIGRLVATQDRMTLEVWRIDGALLHSRDVNDLTPQRLIIEPHEVYLTTEQLPADAGRYVTTVTAPTMLRRVMVSVAASGDTPLTWSLKGGNVTLAAGVMAAGASASEVACLVPNDIIPKFTRLIIFEQNASYGFVAWQGLKVHLDLSRHS